MTFSKQFIEIMDYIGEKFGIAIDWTSDTVWPIVEQLAGKYITWEITTSSFWIFLFFLGIIGCSIWLRWVHKEVKANGGYWEDHTACGMIFSMMGIIICIIPTVVQCFDIIRCVVFPELELFQFLQRTLNSMTQ